MNESTTAAPTPAGQSLEALRQRINGQLVGQPRVVDQVLVALLANGHVLLEGVPGLGKTLLVRVLAQCFAGQFKRIQFTPDLMPADVTGHVLYDATTSQFRLRQGPVFTNLLLADEINRAPAKTQAALLEVMQERQVTLEGEPHLMPSPFMVLATQNPIEQEGTYALPEAELDRFLMKVLMDYPGEADEIALTRQITSGQVSDTASSTHDSPLLSAAEITALQWRAAQVTLDARVLEYAVRLVRATRASATLLRGAGTRGCIALVRCARAQALLQGRDFVTPDDVKDMALPVLRHRVALSAEMEIDGFSTDQVLTRLLDHVDAPRL